MNVGQKIGYKRVSTLVQNTDRQLADLDENYHLFGR